MILSQVMLLELVFVEQKMQGGLGFRDIDLWNLVAVFILM